MPMLYVAGALAALPWATWAIVRGSPALSVALFFVAACVFPAEFFSIDAGGLTWTLDRLLLVAIAAQLGVAWYRGRLVFRGWEAVDLAMIAFVFWLVLRTVTQPWGSVLPDQPPTLMHLVNGYLIPVFLYATLRLWRLDPARLRVPGMIVCGLGIYLGATALFEVAGMWSLVLPRFISDPALGIHFGRARGPMLQSVRLGLALIACLAPLVVYAFWLPPRTHAKLAIGAAALPLGFAAIFATYTRSVWLGLGCVTVTLVVLCMQGPTRRAVLVGILGVVVLVGATKGSDMIAFKREYSAAETRESTYMRAAFAYVSVAMFRDRPIAGFGFNQFQIHNRPYLSDRSTDIRLESIRGYVHHNGYLSLLVDLGLVGFALYAWLGLAALMQTLALWQCLAVPPWARGLALIALAIGGAHAIQMAFHELSFSVLENGFLCAALGLVVAANQQYRPRL